MKTPRFLGRASSLLAGTITLSLACSSTAPDDGDGPGSGGQGDSVPGSGGALEGGESGGGSGGQDTSAGGASGPAGGNSGDGGALSGGGGTLIEGAGGNSENAGGGPDTNAGGSGTGGTTPTGSLTVSNLKIEANPRMSLSCYVSWTTDQPANSEVDFGVGTYALRVASSELVTEHRVHVIGMHAETAYDIKAVSTNVDATGSAEGNFITGALPAKLPSSGTLFANIPEKTQPGWTLTNFQVGSPNANGTVLSDDPAIIVVLDEEAIPVWYYVHGTKPDSYGMTSTEWLPEGTIVVGNSDPEPAREVDMEGNILWTGPTGGSAALSHHTSKLSTGNFLVIRESASSARVEELDPTQNNAVVWSWDIYDHVTPSGAADWCHLNSASTNLANDTVYLNCRWQGLFKVNRADKNLVWHMGAAEYATNTGDVTYLPNQAARFNDAHDPEIHEDGTVLFYDNQGFAKHTVGEQNGNFHSRVVEYQMNNVKEATLIWEFPGSFDVDPWFKENWATPYWGDADRLDNNNVLITAGVRGTNTETRIFEVTRAGEVVWGMAWPQDNGSYRADRLPALAERIP